MRKCILVFAGSSVHGLFVEMYFSVYNQVDSGWLNQEHLQGSLTCWQGLNSSSSEQNGHHFRRRYFQMNFDEWKVLYFD